MNKILTIEGMGCEHCKTAVERGLGALPGVESAVVSLEGGTATVALNADAADSVLSRAVAEAGYTVTAIREA